MGGVLERDHILHGGKRGELPHTSATVKNLPCSSLGRRMYPRLAQPMGMRRLRHCLVSTLSSISAMLSQLSCFGV